MKTRFIHARRLVVAIAAACFTCIASAGEVHDREIDVDEDNLVSFHIEASFRHHAAAAAVWFLDATHGSTVSSRQFRTFANRFESGTFAEFEYTYLDRETERTRVYYASSGTAEPFLGTRDVVPTHPYSTFLDVGSVVAHGEVLESNDTQIVATPVDGDYGGIGRANDAELKAVRTIEREIQANVVTARRGRIVAYISQPMCTSCERAVREFAARYDVEVTVNHLSRDGIAAREFKRKRAAFMGTVRASVPGLPARSVGTSPPPGDGGGPSQCGAIATH